MRHDGGRSVGAGAEPASRRGAARAASPAPLCATLWRLTGTRYLRWGCVNPARGRSQNCSPRAIACGGDALSNSWDSSGRLFPRAPRAWLRDREDARSRALLAWPPRGSLISYLGDTMAAALTGHSDDCSYMICRDRGKSGTSGPCARTVLRGHPQAGTWSSGFALPLHYGTSEAAARTPQRGVSVVSAFRCFGC